MALGGFFSRLKEGLSRSTQKLSEGITAVFRKRRLDDEALEELQDLLISADLGTEVAKRVIAAFRRTRFGTEVTDEEIKTALAKPDGPDVDVVITEHGVADLRGLFPCSADFQRRLLVGHLR